MPPSSVDHETTGHSQFVSSGIGQACAAYLDDVALFTGFTGWTADVLAARGVPPHALIAGLGLVRERVRDFPRAEGFLTAALDALKEARA